MITKDIAEDLRHGAELWHVTGKNADGTPLRARVNGKCLTWKTRPEEFRLPVKHGLKDYFYLARTPQGGNERPGSEWCLPDRWEVEKFWKD
jgi:hypothetical protein